MQHGGAHQSAARMATEPTTSVKAVTDVRTKIVELDSVSFCTPDIK
jgi:hypothetical protein